jgi:hypothetical protein
VGSEINVSQFSTRQTLQVKFILVVAQTVPKAKQAQFLSVSTHNHVDRMRNQKTISCLLSVTVALIILIIIVFLPLDFVASQGIHIGFVKNHPAKIIVDARRSVERVLHDVDFCHAPLDHYKLAIYKSDSCAHVDNRGKRWKVNNHGIISLT